MEIYKLAVEMADRVSGRRATIGFLPVQGVLAALVAVHGIDRVLLASAGIVIDFAWWTLLTAYKSLAAAKFRAIWLLEERLPFAMYKSEWQYLTEEMHAWGFRRWDRAINYSFVERLLPLIFGVFFAVVLIEAIIQW